jgi:hypothetical protein
VDADDCCPLSTCKHEETAAIITHAAAIEQVKAQDEALKAQDEALKAQKLADEQSGATGLDLLPEGTAVKVLNLVSAQQVCTSRAHLLRARYLPKLNGPSRSTTVK